MKKDGKCDADGDSEWLELLQSAVSSVAKTVSGKFSLEKITHLYLQEKNLQSLKDFPRCPNLVVLYLHNNKLTKICDLSSIKNITHLYLQNNCLATIEHLDCLRNLRKLYLTKNKISVLEGLEIFQQMEELHMDYQNLSKGTELRIDPKSILALKNSIKVLNLSGNQMSTINRLAMLNKLEDFLCSDNNLSDLEDVCSVIKTWERLRHLKLDKNPISKHRKYKVEVIGSCSSLRQLDGKEVPSSLRMRLNSFQQFLENRKRNADNLNSVWLRRNAS